MTRSIRKRRLQRKTDYKARLGLLKSETPRLVIRKTNRYLIAQIVKTDIAKDKVVTGVNSKQLIGLGWPKESRGSLKSLPAAYLTGLLIGRASESKKIKKEILDIGMYRNVHKSRIYAVLKGALDAGLEVSHDKEALPSMEEIKKNKKVAQLMEKLNK